MNIDIILYIALGLVGIILLVFVVILSPLFNLYIQAYFSEAPIPFAQLVRLRLSKIDPMTIAYSHIRLVKGIKVQVPISDLVNHYQAGGRLPLVVNALITADRGGFDLTWEEACIADLEGRDVLEEAQDRLHQIRRARGEID